MAVEINGEIVEHEEPTKYDQLLFELKSKKKQLEKLQDQVNELEDICNLLENYIKK